MDLNKDSWYRDLIIGRDAIGFYTNYTLNYKPYEELEKIMRARVLLDHKDRHLTITLILNTDD